MDVGSFFSGIGGLDLGLEQAGMRTLWQVEKDEQALAVLERHFPHTKKYTDVKEITAANLEPVDVVAGGFPCQDVSKAGSRKGIAEGTRSGLWFEMFRVIRELRTVRNSRLRYVIVENVPGLLDGGIGIVLADLASVGFNAEWESLPALAFGATHVRDRVFIVAHLDGERSIYGEARRLATETRLKAFRDISAGGDVRELRREAESGWPFRHFRGIPEPDVARVVHGDPSRLDKGRVRGLGNAVYPEVGKWIGTQIMRFDKRTR